MSISKAVSEPEPATRSQASRNRQIVEGALLADIAVVLLLGRIYLPIPIVRTMWRLLAGAPFVLLAQRQGIRVTIMSGIVAYLLLTALVGPTLALTALDTAFAAIIIAVALHFRWPRAVTAVIGGFVYAVCDIVVPTVIFTVLFRIPISTLVNAIRNAMHGIFRVSSQILDAVNSALTSIFGPSAPQFPAVGFRAFGYSTTSFVLGHWVVFALIAALIAGVANVYAYQAASELVLDRLPPTTRLRQATT